MIVVFLKDLVGGGWRRSATDRQTLQSKHLFIFRFHHLIGGKLNLTDGTFHLPPFHPAVSDLSGARSVMCALRLLVPGTL